MLNWLDGSYQEGENRQEKENCEDEHLCEEFSSDKSVPLQSQDVNNYIFYRVKMVKLSSNVVLHRVVSHRVVLHVLHARDRFD